MEHVSLDEVESRMGPADVKRPLSRALGADDVAINYFELDPEDSLAFGYHTHHDQEEIFYVQSGTITFETDEGEVEVSGGEAIRFAPGEYQQGRNESEERASVLAIGAPSEMGETPILRECPECGKRTENVVEMADDRSALITVCQECGAQTGRFE